MELIDTHCHIQFSDYGLDSEIVIKDAAKDGVTRLLCVGCTLEDSIGAIEFAAKYENVWASVGLHPHESSHYVNDSKKLVEFSRLASKDKVVAIGETGLDYYYMNSPKADQKKMLKLQIELGLKHDLPFVFHVRDAQKQDKDTTGQAFDDFWSILDDYEGIRGVVHSFTSDTKNMEECLSRGLHIGLNGIITFSKDHKLTEVIKNVPLSKLLLETDAPFLTPMPFRGTICQSKHTRVVAEYLANIRGEDLSKIAKQTTANAKKLFNIL